MIWNRDPLVSRFRSLQDQCDRRPDVPAHIAIAGITLRRGALPKRREESSRDGQDLVADTMQADSFRPWPVEEECGDRFKYFLTQFLPRIPICEDVFRKAFGAVSAIGLLDSFKHRFTHTSIISRAISDACRRRTGVLRYFVDRTAGKTAGTAGLATGVTGMDTTEADLGVGCGPGGPPHLTSAPSGRGSETACRNSRERARQATQCDGPPHRG